MTPRSGSARRLASRTVEVTIGLFGLSIVAVTVWFLLMVVAEGPIEGVSTLTHWAIIYVVFVLLSAATLFCLRLVVPALRPRPGTIVGARGQAAFYFVYGALLLVALVQGQRSAYRTVTVVLIGCATALGIRALRK